MIMNKQLLEQIQNAVKNTVSDSTIGVAFSGGVDSTLMSKICLDLGYDLTLLTVGFSDSHDILFAKKINEFLKLPHKILEIESSTFQDICIKIKKIIKTDNLSWNENSIAFYYVSKLAQSLDLKTVVTANGIDELFCCYNAYRDAFSKGKSFVLELIDSKITNELSMMKAVNMVTSELDVKILQPLLSSQFVNYAKSIPISEKIHSSDDLMRKHVIRELAKKIGVPELSANKRKKALQYGSLIHKSLLKSKQTSL